MDKPQFGGRPQRICAWLHHELTGKWPNEGNHHGRRGKRPKKRSVRRRLRRSRGKKNFDNGSITVSDEDAGDLTIVLAAASVSCSSCHEDHHTAESTCRACHATAPLEQHPVDEVHVTCTGSGCHEASSFSPPGRTREFCLACHQDLVEHKIEDDRDCAACHTLPAPRDGGG